MKKLPLIIAMTLVLSACNDDTSEQKEFIDQVKASTTPKVEPIPEITKFEHFAYNAGKLRSPFVAPKPEIIQSNLVQVKNCLHPDPNRVRQPLEKYPLDNLVMQGTIGRVGNTWALIKAADDTLYRVTVGNYYRIIRINPGWGWLLERAPD